MRIALVLGLARALAPPPPASSARSGPAPDVPPRDVVHSQMAALQRSDVGQCYAFAAPANRLVTGPLERFERMVRDSPAYAPLIGCSRWDFVGALQISERRYLVRVRVAPPYGSSAPYAAAWPRTVDYTFMLGRQTEPPWEDMWMTEEVMPDFEPPND